MMKLLAVGRLKPGPERDLLARYLGRLRPGLEIAEIPQAKGNAGEQKKRESEALLAACPDNAFMIALDEGGRMFDSLAFSNHLKTWQETARPVCFMIGGAEGLGSSVIKRADATLSFGKMTWPHILVRILLVEQIFRAQSIATGHPYHRAGRPG